MAEAFYDPDQQNWVVMDNLSNELILVDIGELITLRDELSRIIEEQLEVMKIEERR